MLQENLFYKLTEKNITELTTVAILRRAEQTKTHSLGLELSRVRLNGVGDLSIFCREV